MVAHCLEIDYESEGLMMVRVVGMMIVSVLIQTWQGRAPIPCAGRQGLQAKRRGREEGEEPLVPKGLEGKGGAQP